MNRLQRPRFDTRRRKDLRDELIERARGWLPEWRRTEGDDFAAAIFEIAARLSSEVHRTPRSRSRKGVPRVPGLAGRSRTGRTCGSVAGGFHDGGRVRAGRGRRARTVPGERCGSAGDLRDGAATDDRPRRARVDRRRRSGQRRLLPAACRILGAGGPPAVPNRWRVKAAAPIGATQIQIEPELGADDLPTLMHMKSGQHDRVVGVEGGIVTIDPPVGQVEPMAAQPRRLRCRWRSMTS